ncbi:ATP-dependent DNA helicase [Cellulosimicrobium cellulans]|nr:ATP-dependent DNA helicase [Cellulosimicrobium cellulans]MCO7273152.1 ATP-dependent DNA helicase [Cellulosimicrobium cellulans]
MPDVDALLDVAVTRLGGARRDGQHAMARAVTDAIEGSEHLVVQAGTGTGKSLGYLVPAVRHAVATDERVIVSTATLALQRQVITRDLPLVADAVADRLPRPVTIALLKGWHNYLCVHKIAGGYPADEPTLFDLPGESAGAADHPAARGGTSAAALGEQVVRLRAWAEETSTGDRDDLVPGVSDKAWRQVSVTALECLGQRCPLLAECFPEKARATAREADVVVTNHAMLGIAAMGSPGVLPEHDVLVVDEAHELADRVTAAATVDLSVPAIESAARLARRHGGVTTDALDAASAAFGTVVGSLPAERFPDGLPDGARSAVAAVRDAAREVLSTLKPETGVTKPAQPDSGLKMAQSTMLQLFEVAERMAADPTGHDVLWCSRPGEGGWSADRFGEGASRLHAAPLGVAGLIRTHLLAERTGVFTSATLALGGSFDAVARTFGLGGGGEGGDADGPRWRGLDVGSPFDYARQGILYVAKALPTPGREASTEHQLDEIAALVEAAGGRTLGLFSSRRAAVAAAEAMRERLDVPILCQGDDQLPTLVREFTDDPATCLFGTLSLWQGVDVPGPSCQLVLIDRIPFPRPDDPVKSARARAVEAAGGNGFMQVSATHAALLLAQGAGRLVRSTTDRGVVAVLDPRLVTARYGTFLTRSMPGFWQTTDRDVATGALRRLAALG